jgi:hypothetical protein
MNQKISPLEKWLLATEKQDEYFTDVKFPKLRNFLVKKGKKDSSNSVSPKSKMKFNIRILYLKKMKSL